MSNVKDPGNGPATDSYTVFSDIVAGRLPASFVYRDEVVCAFMDTQPVNPGHVLVIPNERVSSLAELAEDTGAHIWRIGHRIARALRDTDLKCEGVNLFLADGEAAGQEVFHVHLHVFPRYAGDGFALKHGEHYHDLPGREQLDRDASLISEALKAI